MTGRPNTLGSRVRRYRVAAGWTQRELADRAAIGLRTLRDLESDRVSAPRARSIHRLIIALELDDAARDELLAGMAGCPSTEDDDSGSATIGVLGPLLVRRGGESLKVGTAPGLLLSLLAIQPQRIVGREEIIEVLWGGLPPDSHRHLIQVYVTALRRLLGARRTRRSSSGPLHTVRNGYVLAAGPDELDLLRFEQATAQAHAAHLAGDAQEALHRYGRALRCWRGALLGDAYPSLSEHPAAVAINGRRVSATVAYAGLATELDRSADAVAALRVLAAAQPLHEGIAAALMVALAATGQRAAALKLYADVRARLADELGIGPGSDLQRAHLRVVQPVTTVVTAFTPESASPEPVPGPGGPAQLPPDVSAFTGRHRQLRGLDALLPAAQQRATAMPVGVITGTAGVGKTSLAVHWAHRVRHRFPDGQAYLDLRGYAPVPPMSPLQALVTILRAFGVTAEQIPMDLDRCTDMYRTLLASQRVLVVLDNALSPDQVRPLLPGSAGCFVLITSRDRLTGLAARNGAHRTVLAPLSIAESRTLLSRTLGGQRTRAEADATTDLARACGGLPLALRIAAANLADQPWRTIASYVAELRSGDRLAALQAEGDEKSGLRAAFELSYAALTRDEQRMFRLLGLVCGPDVTVETAAALADIAVTPADSTLQRLARFNLVTARTDDRYALHDLLRLYAADQVGRHESAAQQAEARRRLYDWYLHGVHVAAHRLYPDKLRLPPAGGQAVQTAAEPAPDDVSHALAWLDSERPNLVATVQHTAEHGPRSVAWRLADGLRGYFLLRRHNVDWITVARSALAAAQSDGDLPGQTSAALSLADAHTRMGQYDLAIDYYRRAAALAAESGSIIGQAAALSNLGGVYRLSNRPTEAADHYRRSLALNRQAGRVAGQAACLINIGTTYWDLGRLTAASHRYRQALALYRQIGSRAGEGAALGNLGEVHHALGDLDDAVRYLTTALQLHRETGGRGSEADVLRMLAEVHSDAGRHAYAMGIATTAVALNREIGDRRYEADALNSLATTCSRMGDHVRAIELHQQAQSIACGLTADTTRVAALLGLTGAYQGLGESAAAVTHAQSAATLAHQRGYLALEGQARIALANAQLAAGLPDLAVVEAERGLVVIERTGQRPAREQAQRVLELARQDQASVRIGAPSESP